MDLSSQAQKEEGLWGPLTVPGTGGLHCLQTWVHSHHVPADISNAKAALMAVVKLNGSPSQQHKSRKRTRMDKRKVDRNRKEVTESGEKSLKRQYIYVQNCQAT